MKFDIERAGANAHPNCRHCFGRGYQLRSHPDRVGNGISWHDYCRCATKPYKEPVNLKKPIEVFVIGDGSNG